MSYWEYPQYISVAQKQAKAEKKLKQLQKKMPDIRPVRLTGTMLARSWWAKTWNKNLERYADYHNRIGRGRSYLRHGAVLDLRITAGMVSALVMGSAANPYKVEIEIKPLSRTQWQAIKQQCEGNLKSLQDLLAGKFPKTLGEIFFDPDQGLFPAPKGIRFTCSCPDSASMCKHVAATLYGIGARFDEDPSLFFTLRGVKSEDLGGEAIRDTTEALLTKTRRKSAKVLDEADLGDLFGIDMESLPDFSAPPGKAAKGKKALQPKAPVTNAPAAQKKPSSARPTPTPPPGKQQPPSLLSATDQVAALIPTGGSGIGVAELVAQTGYTKGKIYGIVHRLKQAGIIINAAHGRYVKK
jgi:uncharacterized Zn finger protein